MFRIWLCCFSVCDDLMWNDMSGWVWLEFTCLLWWLCSKTLLKLTIPRIKLLRNRREIQLKQMRRDIAKLLETGQEATARIRVEAGFNLKNCVLLMCEWSFRYDCNCSVLKWCSGWAYYKRGENDGSAGDHWTVLWAY